MWSFEREQLESPDVNSKAVPLSKPVVATTVQDVGSTKSTSPAVNNVGGTSPTSNTSFQDMGGQIAAVPPEGRFYAYIHNIADDNTWRYTLIFASRDIADQWWRAVSTSTVTLLQNIQRISPQFYTHDPRQWNICLFFTDPRVVTIADQFRGKFSMVLENDRVGRGISILPTQNIVDYTSGNWFTIRSRSNPNNYWFYDESQGFIVSSSTHHTSFQITAPDLAVGTILIGTDDITITAQNHGYATPGAANATGGNSLQVAGASSQVAFRFKFSDLKSGRFITNSSIPGNAILYMSHGRAGSGWEIWQ
ncbi:hypothetical protein HYPSUDRAFT_675054 [Hypholoma sublateritium FD-334 SS-4]|uniref:Uncharacterized protein n=1 Tax=Hypholoma sublateritium (strain FD-334 SS-4) TaxID=945553 RepID=A0A0D2NSM0_HYPSF|nr:hypothetical protein HYPSUDRAFT_675054 [Hypholoma sublateritium FD-334 SS-4]